MAPKAVVNRLGLEFNGQGIAFLDGFFEPVETRFGLAEQEMNPRDDKRGYVSVCGLEPSTEARSKT